MIQAVTIEMNVLNRIRTSGCELSHGKLLGTVDRQANTVSVYDAVPLGVVPNRWSRTVGTFGMTLNQRPSFPKRDEVFLQIPPDSQTVTAYRVLSQGVEEIPMVEIKNNAEVFQRLDGVVNVASLSHKRVVIVGLGSVGSILALELAKAGVGHFRLIDPDTLSVSNVCRHVGDLGDVGKYKTRLVQERILRRNPGASIETDEGDVLVFTTDEARERFQDVDLIVAATDSQQATERLNELALELGVPILWIGLYERASWGHILYAIPGNTPCLGCVLPTLVDIGNLTPRTERIVDYSSGEDPSQITAEPGLGTDIGFVTLAGAKIALALLLKDAPTSGVGKILPSGKTLLVVGNAPGSIVVSTQAFQTNWLTTRAREGCSACQKEARSLKRFGKTFDEVEAEAQRFLARIPDVSTGECEEQDRYER